MAKPEFKQLSKDSSDVNLVERIFKQSFGSMQKKTFDGPRALSPYSKQLSEEELKARNEADRNSFIDRIWNKYDQDDNGNLDASEMKRLVDRFTGENVSLHHVEEFLQEIDQDGDALIQKDELRDFITFGLTLSKQSREEYALRGPLQKTIVKFFYGLDGSARIHAKEQRAIERQKIQEAHLIAQKEERLRQKRLMEIRLKKEREKELKSKPPKRSFLVVERDVVSNLRMINQNQRSLASRTL